MGIERSNTYHTTEGLVKYAYNTLSSVRLVNEFHQPQHRRNLNVLAIKMSSKGIMISLAFLSGVAPTSVLRWSMLASPGTTQ